jgi:hypothetical protein
MHYRRFDIYSKTVDFVLHLRMMPRAMGPYYGDAEIVLRNNFLKAHREAQFLFSKSSGVYALIYEIDRLSGDILYFTADEANLARDNPELYKQMSTSRIAALKRMQTVLDELDGKIMRYLTFDHIQAISSLEDLLDSPDQS